jgi:hypothetical protein
MSIIIANPCLPAKQEVVKGEFDGRRDKRILVKIIGE